MDGNLIASLTGTATSGTKSKKSDKPDGDAFSACLDDASKAKGESNKANEALIDDSAKSDKKDDKEAKRKAAKQELEEQLKGAANGRDLRTSALARKLMQNVDTMTTAEKQALQVGEFSHEAATKAETTKMGPGGMPAQLAYPGQMPPGLSMGQAAAARANRGASTPGEAVETREQAQRTEKQATEAAKEQSNQPTLEQMIAKESKFTEELQQAQNLDRNQERQAVIDQVLKQIEVRNFQGKTELNLRLNPEYLGELKIKLLHTDEGVSAQFITDSRTTREVLEENESDLRSEAGKKGIRLGRMKVQLVENLGQA